MNHALTAWIDQTFEERRAFARFTDDPLSAIRGIAFSVLGSVLVFWLPIAFVLSR